MAPGAGKGFSRADGGAPSGHNGYNIWGHFNFPMLNPHWPVCKYGPHLCLQVSIYSFKDVLVGRPYSCEIRMLYVSYGKKWLLPIRTSLNISFVLK